MTYTNPLPPAMQVTTWNETLRVESLLEDCFTKLRGIYTTSVRREVGNDVYLDIEGQGVNQSRFHVMTLHKALSGAPTEGSTANPVGGEEDLINKNFTVFYTDWGHQVSLQNYGIEKNCKDYFKIFEMVNPDMAVWVKEIEGKYIREALTERYSHNLTAAPHFLVQEFNPNIAIAGLHPSQFPVFSQTPATYVNNIGLGLTAAGVGAQACMTIRFAQLLEEWASAEKTIDPVFLDGKETYLLIIPSPQARYLKDPINAGGLGSRIMGVAETLTNLELGFPGVVTRIGRLLIIEDPRYITLTLGGSTGAFSLTVQYKWAGRDPITSDPRDKSLTARQGGWLLGRAAIAKWQPEKWHYEWEFERYDKFAGKGIYNSSGFNLVEWDYGATDPVNPPTAATRQNDGSILILFSTPPLQT